LIQSKSLREEFMSVQKVLQSRNARKRALGFLFILPACLTTAEFVSSGRAADGQAPVGTCISDTATILSRSGPQAPWQIVKQGDVLQSGAMLVGMSGAVLDSKDSAIRLTFLGDLDKNSPYPILENAVILHADAHADLAFTLDRGRVDLVNRKERGKTVARVSVRQSSWELEMPEPGTRVALETYSRWPRGTRFSKTSDPKNAPTASLIVLVLKGEVHVRHGGFEHRMTAPPGPAMFEWDSLSGADEAPQHLDKLPAWAQREGESTPLAKERKAVLERFRQALINKGVNGAVEEFLDSTNQMDRTLAVFVMGALDDLPRLGKALREAKHFDVWDNGVLALRHWIGRGPGQDQILYRGLVEERKLKPVHAEAVLQLLHSFGDEDLARPELYQTLIDNLDHDQLAIRGLAYWHLYRLVPAGQALGYDPLASKDERDAAVEKWRKLVPPGTVPRRAGPAK
jgi:hypothetical protein